MSNDNRMTYREYAMHVQALFGDIDLSNGLRDRIAKTQRYSGWFESIYERDCRPMESQIKRLEREIAKEEDSLSHPSSECTTRAQATTRAANRGQSARRLASLKQSLNQLKERLNAEDCQ